MLDKTLQKLVEDALAWKPSVDAARIGVTAQAGVVTLSGSVGSYAQKVAAERAVRGVRGVRAIAQETEVRLPSNQKRSDDETARRVLDILRWDVTAPDETVTMRVEHGAVTLEGSVQWQFQRVRAENLAHQLSGVVGMVNHIRLQPVAERADLHRKIEGALRRAAILDASRITVGIEDGKVTLAGTVHFWAERAAAEGAVWAAPGVSQLEDHITVRP